MVVTGVVTGVNCWALAEIRVTPAAALLVTKPETRLHLYYFTQGRHGAVPVFLAGPAQIRSQTAAFAFDRRPERVEGGAMARNLRREYPGADYGRKRR